jgi:two-component system, cell cycle sensor histidine kinase PleC
MPMNFRDGQFTRTVFFISANILAIGIVEWGRYSGTPAPIPFLIIYATVVASGGAAGKLAGGVSGALAALYVFYSSLIGFGPPTLTGGVVQVCLGMSLYAGSGYFLGRVRAQRNQYLQEVQRNEKELEAEIVARTNDLRKSDRLLQVILDHAPAKINLRDPEGRYLIVNKDFAKARGLTPNVMIGTTVHDKSTPDHAGKASSHHTAVLESGETIVQERDTVLPDGSAYKALVTKFPVFDENGTVAQIGSIGIDITDLKEAESQLVLAREEAEIADRSKSEFLANMSHELRTPLNAVIGFAEALDTGIYGTVNDRQKVVIVDVVHAAGHLLDLINDILDLSKIEAGEFKPNLEDINIDHVVQDTIRLIAVRAEGQDVAITATSSPEISTLNADERIVKQMLINLLSNAVKFTPARGGVHITTIRENDGGVTIAVRDTGIGMNKDDIPKALSSFGQIDGSLSRRYEGTGLGLPLVAAFMVLHGGVLEIDSELGVGTTARLKFPPKLAKPAKPADDER